ncbi:MAG: hypothetical protein KF819_30150 [Labilithrix sp.]|nr:hypothetical protein [Labilithrix sp.]
MRHSATTSLFALIVSIAACGSDTEPGPEPTPAGGGTRSLFAIPASLDAIGPADFFDHPFPSDLRRDADGAAVFRGFPNPVALPLLDQYIQNTKGLVKGFSPAAATYLRFTGPIDPATLPADPPASLASDASVQIVDVDPASPERGKRHLAQTHWQRDEGVYWPASTLAVIPMLGRPLRPATRYAVVVTSRVKAEGGGTIAASDEVAEILDLRPVTDKTRAVHDLFAPAVKELATAGVAAADIVHLTVFTTADPTAETYAAMDDVAAAVPAPTASAWQREASDADYTIYEGSYGPSPNYQAGTPPFRKPVDGGGFALENGRPKLQNTFDLRFALAVPNETACPPPAAGYPVVLYAHGTGGDYRSFIGDGTARSLAQKCLASMGIDQILHGTRPGAPALDDPQRETTTQLLFFNLDNELAARTSNRQSAIDVVQQARLFTETKVKVPASVTNAAEIGFDPTKIMFFGHSQGGLNGPLFLAGSALARGGVLSGAGSHIGLNLLEKTKPVDVAAAFRFLVGLGDPERAAELNVFHPVLTLVQTIIDAADPLHYGAAITRAPRTGFAPKSIYQTEGVSADGTGDTYAPPHGIELLSVAIGLPRHAPGIKPIREAQWCGLDDLTVTAEGVSGNLGDGQASGVLAQFAPRPGRDGHFVIFDLPQARAQAAGFLANLAADPKGRIPPQ